MSEEQIAQFLQDNIDYMINNDIVLWLFRTIGWALVTLLSFLINVGKELYDFTYSLVDITSWSGLDAWINEFKPLVTTIIMVSLVALGFMYMFGKNKKHNLLYSILIFGLVVTSSNYLFSQLNDWAIVFKDAVVGTGEVANGTELVRTNLYDLRYIDEQIGLKNMSNGNRPQYSSLTEAEMKYIEITEVLNWDDIENSDTKDILKKKLQFRSGGVNALVDVSNGVAWTSIGNDLYFRYKFHFGTYFLDALAVILIYFCLSYKNVRITYELFVGRVLATLKAGDLSTSKKMVVILESIRDQYFALCFTAITIRSYFIFSDFIKQMVGDASITRAIVTLFIAFCVIDGSNIMQKITGVDAGLSTMTGKLLAASHMVQASASMMNQHRILRSMKGNSKNQSNVSSPTMNVNSEKNTAAMDKDIEQPGKDKNAANNNTTVNKEHGKTGENGSTKPAEGVNSDKKMGAMDQELQSVGKQDINPTDFPETNAKNGNAETDPHFDAGETDRGQMDSGSNQGDSSGREGADDSMERMDQALGQRNANGTFEESKQMGGYAMGETKNGKNPEQGMFQKWDERKKEKGMDSFSGEHGHTKKQPSHQTDHQKREPYHNSTGAKTTSAGQTETTEQKKTKISEETVGKHRYVGGEAVPSKRRSKSKKED